jgi:HK97 family phage major capsid protein
MQLEELQGRLETLKADNDAILAKAQAEKRDLSVEESKQFDGNQEAFDQTIANIQRLQRDAEQQEMLTRGTGRVTKPAQPASEPEELGTNEAPKPRKPSIVPVDNPIFAKTGGFKSLGDMAYFVRRAALEGGATDPRLERLAAASTYGNESSGADGGFAVPTDFRSAIMQTVLAEDSLAAMCDQVTTGSNTFTCPVDETSPWQTSGGIQANWEGEAQAGGQSKPSLQDRTVKLNKLKALVPMTDELLDDASAMDSYLRRKAPEKIAFKLNLAIIQGTGAGQPLGILNSGALVTVSKNSPQTADTLTGKNIIDMWSRMYTASRQRAVWVINPDIEPQLLKLSIAGTDNEGNAVTGWGQMVYMPPNGLSQSPFGTLMGRPVIPSQACETLGDKGDIFFFDPTQYLLLLKGGVNPRVETSMHLWFDQDLTAFRFVLRVGGMPWWSTTLAARDGSATYSPYVTLEAR